jgi:hypothetical protein
MASTLPNRTVDFNQATSVDPEPASRASGVGDPTREGSPPARVKRSGRAPPGYVWHHIVEQCRADIFGKEAIQNRWNIVLLGEETHMKGVRIILQKWRI